MLTNEVRQILGSVLSGKQLSVTYSDSSHTAFIDMETLTIHIPTFFSGFRDETNIFVVLHEMAHAKWTNITSDFKKQKHPIYKSAYNVLEDIRIERLLEKKFPNANKYLRHGYGELYHKEFFVHKSINNTELEERCFLDRLNLHSKLFVNTGRSLFKMQCQCDVERDLFTKTDSMLTSEDVHRLAIEICEKLYSDKEEPLEKQDPRQNKGGENESLGSEQHGEGEILPLGQYTKSEKNGEDEKGHRVPKSLEKFEETSKKFEGESEGSVGKTVFMNTDICSKKLYEESINFVDYKIEESFNSDNIMSIYNIQKKFVGELIQQFERRKNAEILSKTQVFKTGKLNPNRLYSYKHNDDIFLKAEKIYNGKNHSVIMYVDTSQSMFCGNTYTNAVKQCITLAMFCDRLKIPFTVYEFSTNSDGGVVITKVLDSFSRIKVKSQIQKYLFLLKNKHSYRHKLPYGGITPTEQAILHSNCEVQRHIEKTNVEVVNLIFLTDGESNGRISIKDLENFSDSSSNNFLFQTKNKRGCITSRPVYAWLCDRIQGLCGRDSDKVFVDDLRYRFQGKVSLNIIGCFLHNGRAPLEYVSHDKRYSQAVTGVMESDKPDKHPFDTFIFVQNMFNDNMKKIEEEVDIPSYTKNGQVSRRFQNKVTSVIKENSTTKKKNRLFAEILCGYLQKKI